MKKKISTGCLTVLLVLSTACQAKVVKVAANPMGPPCTQQRLAACQAAHPDYEMRTGWVANHCSKAPFGPRFEYMVPAWTCLRD